MVISALIVGSCNSSGTNEKKVQVKRTASQSPIIKSPIVIDIIPYQDMPSEITEYVYKHILQINANVRLHRTIPLPVTAFYPARGRYRADSLIRHLSAESPPGHVTLALTTKDISTSKGEFADWGIFGLSYCPGNACVVSNYRIKGNNLNDQFFKVAIHELGHTQGLDHCPVESCYMRDAKGGATMKYEKSFCPKCKKSLVKVGWLL